MTHPYRARKAIFLAIFCAIALIPSLPARAQAVDNSAQIAELQATLLSFLTQLLAQLQAQLADLLAKQAVTEQKVDTVIANQPVLGVASTSAVVEPPLKLMSGQTGSILSYFGAQRYQDRLDDEEKLILVSSQILVTTNKPIDISKTELWVDGEQKTVTATTLREARRMSNGLETRFYLYPNVFSFAKKNADGSYSSKIQLKFGTEKGELVSSLTVPCEAWDSNQDTWPDWSRSCNNMPLSQSN